MKADYQQRLKQMEELAAIRKLWDESEYRLHFLRTNTGKPKQEPTDEALLQWSQECQNQTQFTQ
jgi:hypothetical protein